MRILLTLLFLAGLGAGTYLAYPKYIAPMLGQAPPPTAPKALTADESQACFDDCEQKAIVGQTSETAMRACRAKCGPGGAVGSARKPNEPIRSISRAPADHRKEAIPAAKKP